MYKSVTAHVTGRVQGVGFRYSARIKARSLGLTGWVRNESDGSVSTLFQGAPSDVEEFLSWLKTGPPMSFVKEVTVTELNPDSSLTSFEVSF